MSRTCKRERERDTERERERYRERERERERERDRKEERNKEKRERAPLYSVRVQPAAREGGCYQNFKERNKKQIK